MFAFLKQYCFFYHSLFSLLQLLEILKEIKFTDNEREVYFDSQGDIITGYDVLLWKEIDGRVVITNMGEYDLEKDDFIFADKEDEIEFMNLKVSEGPLKKQWD